MIIIITFLNNAVHIDENIELSVQRDARSADGELPKYAGKYIV